MSQKAILTCALNGVLTNPAQHKVPVTPEEMAVRPACMCIFVISFRAWG